MAYILRNQRDADVTQAFDNYRRYLEDHRKDFPSGGLALAESEWYFNFGENRCPHDSWLQSVEVIENDAGERRQYRTVSIRIKLLNAYHTGRIEFFYPEVFSYQLGGVHTFQGHDDWRYDEFRLSEKNHLIHEIEWAGFGAGDTWLIEASDVEYSYNETKGI